MQNYKGQGMKESLLRLSRLNYSVLSKKEKNLLEAYLFTQLYHQLFEKFKLRYQPYLRLIKHNFGALN